MNSHNRWCVVTLAAVLVPGVAVAQHEAQQPAPQAAAESARCARVQPVVNNIIGAAMGRLETARQSNNPTEMRAAVDHLEAALRDIRTQLAPCSAAAAAADPHAGHTMPSTKQPTSTAAPATQPQTPPASAADPHAGHAATPAKPAPAQPAVRGAESQPKPKSPAATADPHAGHAGTAAQPADPGAKRAAPASKAAPSTKPSAPGDPHAGHGTTGKPGADVKDGNVMDPVTGLMVDPSTAPKTTYQGQTYYFSSEQSRKEFLANPAKFAKRRKE